MPNASTSRVNVAIKPETVFGVIAAAGNPRSLSVTGETLNFEISKERSAEINAFRSSASMVPVSAQSTGGIQGEMQYREWDTLMEGVLQSTFAAFGTNGVGATFIGTFTASTITASVATTGTSLFTTLRPGQWFVLGAPGNANDGRLFRVSKTVAATSTVLTVDPGTPLTVGTSVAGCALRTSRLTNGTTERSFTIERQNLDIAQFFAYTGLTPSKMSIGVASGSLSTISFDFMGKDVQNGVVSQLPGTLQSAYTFDVHSGVSGNNCQMWLNGAPLAGTFVKSATFEYDNTLRMQEAVCSLGAIGIASGSIVSKVDMEVYFSDASIFNQFKNNQYVEVCFSSMDGSGNGYVFTIPRGNISSYNTNASGKDQDMMLSLSIEALRDAANTDANLRQVVFLDRCGVAAV